MDKELAELSSDSGSGTEGSFEGLDDAIEAEMEELGNTDSSTKRKFDTI
jgi:hypothetical protein